MTFSRFRLLALGLISIIAVAVVLLLLSPFWDVSSRSANLVAPLRDHLPVAMEEVLLSMLEHKFTETGVVIVQYPLEGIMSLFFAAKNDGGADQHWELVVASAEGVPILVHKELLLPSQIKAINLGLFEEPLPGHGGALHIVVSRDKEYVLEAEVPIRTESGVAMFFAGR